MYMNILLISYLLSISYRLIKYMVGRNVCLLQQKSTMTTLMERHQRNVRNSKCLIPKLDRIFVSTILLHDCEIILMSVYTHFVVVITEDFVSFCRLFYM